MLSYMQILITADDRNSINGEEGIQVKFKSLVETPRRQSWPYSNEPDFIKECHHLQLPEGYSVSACLRDSGHVDLYWNKRLVDQTDHSEDNLEHHSNGKYLSLAINYDQITAEVMTERNNFAGASSQ